MNALTRTLFRHVSRSIDSTRPICTSKVLSDIFTIQDEKDFEVRVVKSDVPIVVDFYANWCGPCKILGPRLESILADNKKVHLAKINVDDNDLLAEKYEVSSIPAIYGVKNGQIINKFVGVKDDDELRAFIDQLLIK